MGSILLQRIDRRRIVHDLDIRHELTHCLQTLLGPFLPQHVPNRRPGACIGMRGLELDCADGAQSSKRPALADGLDAGLHPVGDLQGALVIGRCYSGWNSVESRAEIFVGLQDAPLFQQELSEIHRSL